MNSITHHLKRLRITWVFVLFLFWSVSYGAVAAQNEAGKKIQEGLSAAEINTTEPAQPVFKHGAYARQSVELSNSAIRLIFFRRLNGWAWGEVYTPSGKCMAVLEHLGEIMLRDQDIPMRLEADTLFAKTGGEKPCFPGEIGCGER